MTRPRALFLNLVGLAVSVTILLGLISSMPSALVSAMPSLPLILTILGLYLIPFVILGFTLRTVTIVMEILTGNEIREYGRPRDQFELRIHLEDVNRFLKERARGEVPEKRTWGKHLLLTHPVFILAISLSGFAGIVYFVSDSSLAMHRITLWLLVLGLPTVGALSAYAIFRLVTGGTR